MSPSILRPLRRVAGRLTRVQREVERAIIVDSPPRRPRQARSVWGVAVVRDDADIVGTTCEHLLGQGLTGLIVLDHRSTDSTATVLSGLATAYPGRVFVGRLDLEAFHQGRAQSYLAHLARRAGAEWVIPFDADEWWYGEGSSLVDVLGRQEADVVRCSVHDARPAGPAWMPGDPLRVKTTPMPRAKVAFRAAPWVWVYEGNHEVDRPGRRGDGLAMLHASYRSPDHVRERVRTGSRSIRAAGPTIAEGVGRHWHVLADLDDEGVAAWWRREQQRVAADDTWVDVADYLAWAAFDPRHEVRSA